MSALLLRLCGPMQAWGTQSRFTQRDTGAEPTKSGVVGLLCAALGRPRSEPVGDLAALRMGVRVDREGLVSRDYHTAGAGTFLGQRYYVASASGTAKNRSVVSQRFYLADADFLVALEGDLPLLQRLQRALDRPRWALYLGRKSFPPARPVSIPDGLRPDEDMESALRRAPWWARTRRELEKTRRLAAGDDESARPRLRLVIETGDRSSGLVAADQPLSFAQRRFDLRARRIDWVTLTEEQIQEDPLCTSPA